MTAIRNALVLMWSESIVRPFLVLAAFQAALCLFGLALWGYITLFS